MTSHYLSPNDCSTFSNDIEDILCDIEFIQLKNRKVGNCPLVFDIEVSSFYQNGEKQCCMYAFVLGINGRCVRGRYWHEFYFMIKRIIKYYDLSITKRLIIYVHNLSYEFQFIKGMFKWYKVFALESRKPIYAITVDGIEFRCSYLLSGYSLEKLGENLNKYKVKKRVGDLDYHLVRHNKTPLTDTEWGYILNDGLVVMAHIQEEIERLGDISKLPLTKTGYVRNLCKERCLKSVTGKQYVSRMKKLTLTPDIYKQLKRGFMGGFTHFNINYVDKTLSSVHSMDFTSSYPAVMLSEMFPMSPPLQTIIQDEDHLIKMLKSYCCIFDCEFENIRSVCGYENYISLSRCTGIDHYIENNGRIVEASRLSMTITEQDFFIITKMYRFDSLKIGNFTYFFKDYLPKEIIEIILDLYAQKTEYKGIPEKIVEYMVSKGMINSMYGMAVTDICRDEDTFDIEWKSTPADIDQCIEKYNANRERTFYYPWGIWVTAYARRNLFTGIFEFQNDYIGCDTDSLKVFNYENHIDYVNSYNNEIQEKIKRCLKRYNIPVERMCPKTIKGVEKPIGVWDYEGRYDRFKALGAKRYMTEEDGKIVITIAGVGKKAGVEYLKWKYKTNIEIFDAFSDQLYFPPEYQDGEELKSGCGKLCHTYIDTLMYGTVTDYLGVTENYSEMSGIHMEATDYSLNLSTIFKKLIQGVKLAEYA